MKNQGREKRLSLSSGGPGSCASRHRSTRSRAAERARGQAAQRDLLLSSEPVAKPGAAAASTPSPRFVQAAAVASAYQTSERSTLNSLPITRDAPHSLPKRPSLPAPASRRCDWPSSAKSHALPTKVRTEPGVHGVRASRASASPYERLCHALPPWDGRLHHLVAGRARSPSAGSKTGGQKTKASPRESFTW